MPRAVITGWGKCLPPARLTNEDLSTLMDTSDEWISTRTGIHERRVSHVSTSTLALVAAQRALAAAGRSASEVDLLITGSASPATLIPCMGAEVQTGLGAFDAGVFDLNAGCTSFLYGLAMAAGTIATGQQKSVLVVGAERLTWYLDWTERDSAVLFGDGAGAALVEASEEDAGVLSWHLGCDGRAADALKVPNFGTDAVRSDGHFGEFQVRFDGREIFKRAVQGMYRASKTALAKADMTLEDVDLLIPHQANKRIIDALSSRLATCCDVVVNIERYGNTSAATIPIALTEELEAGRIKPGTNILMASFGAGLTSAACVVRWGKRTEPLGESDAELPPCDQTGLELIAPQVAYNRSYAGRRTEAQ